MRYWRFTYFINFFKLDIVNCYYYSIYFVLLFLYFILTSYAISPKVKQSSTKCFLSLSTSTTMSLKHYKYLCFSCCLIYTCCSINYFVSNGYLSIIGRNKWATVLLVKSKSWFLTIAYSYEYIKLLKSYVNLLCILAFSVSYSSIFFYVLYFFYLSYFIIGFYNSAFKLFIYYSNGFW